MASLADILAGNYQPQFPQSPRLSEMLMPQPAAPWPSQATPSESDQAQAARDAWAARLSQGQRPPGGRPDGPMLDFVQSAIFPQTPLDVGLYALGGPLSRGAKTAAVALGGALTPTDAEAGTISKLLQGGIRAFHGSPHRFDRFDISKIGTGEGAQAYGRGLYFAENEGVAKAYRDHVKDMAMLSANNKRMSEIAREMESLKVPGSYREFRAPRGYELAKEYDRLMEQKMAPGHMYEVNIRANPDQFLDWDRPLADQSPFVRQRLPPKGTAIDPMHQFFEPPPSRGPGTVPDYYASLAGNEGTSSRILRDAGIPGIKYLDQGSRGAGEGSRNYVVFDDSLIDILRRYGILGVPASGAIANALGDSLPNL